MAQAQSNKEQSNIRKFRKAHVNLGTVIFGLVFVYLFFIVLLYFTRNRVSIYEVTTGNIVENQSYTGLALREEKVIYTNEGGNLSYIAHEGSKVGLRTAVYSVTQGESLSQSIQNQSESISAISDEDYDTLYNDVKNFAAGFERNHFDDVYSFKSTFTSSLLNVLHSGAYSQDASLVSQYGIHYGEDSGVVIYNIDGLETVTTESFRPDMLLRNKYPIEDFKERDVVSPGEPIYKLVTNEPWQVIIRIDDSQKKKYEDDDYVEVRFMKDYTTAWAQIEKFEVDGESFCCLKFTNSMIRFATDRYLDIEVLLDSTSGLKVPNSAIVEKEFFTVPMEYIAVDEEQNKMGIYIYKEGKNGSATESYKEITPYNITEEEAFLDMTSIDSGTIIVKKGTSEQYCIEKIGKLVGVYNVNKGYADFNLVTVEYQNDDYSIVKANESYGLTQYDRIVLDGSSVNDEETIYQ